MHTVTTTAAAELAGVTTATVRVWCRHGAVAAVKVAGRWVIDAASLHTHIARRQEYGMRPMYKVVTSGTRYAVVRTDGTPGGPRVGEDMRILGAVYPTREHADLHAHYVNHTPAVYRIERVYTKQFPAGYEWRLDGGRNDDPGNLRRSWREHQAAPAGATVAEHLVRITLVHDAQAPDRQVLAAAEAIVRDVLVEQPDAEAGRGADSLATHRQIDYILRLLATRDGDESGFWRGPTDRAGIARLTRAEASRYIDSLTGEY